MQLLCWNNILGPWIIEAPTPAGGESMMRRNSSTKSGAEPDRATVEHPFQRFALAMDAVAVAHPSRGGDPDVYLDALCDAASCRMEIGRSQRARLAAATSPEEKWAAALDVARAGLLLSFLAAEIAEQCWLRGLPPEQVGNFVASSLRIADWLDDRGVAASAFLAARSHADFPDLDRIDALREAIQHCPVHPGRKPDLSVSRSDREWLELASMALATECIRDKQPSDAKLRKYLSKAFEQELEKSQLLLPRSKHKRRLLNAKSLDAPASNTDRKKSSLEVVDAASVIDLVQIAETERMVEHIRNECIARGPASVAAFEYKLLEGTRSAIARHHRVSVKQLRRAEEFVDARLASLRRKLAGE